MLLAEAAAVLPTAQSSSVALNVGVRRYDAAIKASRFADTQIKGMVKCMEVVTHHRAAHLPETIGALGWANAADTNICERRHVDIKAEFERTTRRPANAVDQVCERVRLRECVSSSFVSRSTPDPLNPAAAREPPATNAAVGNHPLREFSLPQRVPVDRKAPAVGAPCANASELLWAPEAVAASLKTRKAQEEVVAKQLRRYYDVHHPHTDVPATPIQLKSGVKLITVFQNQVPNSKGRAVIHSEELPPESQANYRPSHRPITARVTDQLPPARRGPRSGQPGSPAITPDLAD